MQFEPCTSGIITSIERTNVLIERKQQVSVTKLLHIESVTGSLISAERIASAIQRIHKISAILSKICDTGLYLDVSPKVLWVSEEEIKELIIRSNVNWNIN